ncbi:phage tail protein [Phormidesmis sp. 146-12]
MNLAVDTQSIFIHDAAIAHGSDRRSLYLDFLPEIYQEIDLVNRLLMIFEEAFEPSVQTLDTLWAYLDPLTAPDAMLPFLAHWVGWSFDIPFDPEQQRRLIRQAIELYRWRGTRRGLRLYLHLVTKLPLDDHLTRAEDEPKKHISIQTDRSQGFVIGGCIGSKNLLGEGNPYHFVVHLRCDNTGQINESLVRQVIEQEKPAFCTYDLFIHPVNTHVIHSVDPCSSKNLVEQ